MSIYVDNAGNIMIIPPIQQNLTAFVWQYLLKHTLQLYFIQENGRIGHHAPLHSRINVMETYKRNHHIMEETEDNYALITLLSSC